MANTSLKRIRTFIEMYDKPITITGSQSQWQVNHQTGADDYNIYYCKSLTAVAECVNDIIFKIDMGDRAVPAK